MREIFFRGIPKRKQDYIFFKKAYKAYCEGSFVKGSLLIDESTGRYYIVCAIIAKINCMVGNAQSTAIEVLPETVGTYTGLTDKNGKKIFEGDILSIERKGDGLGTYYFPPIKYLANVIVKWDMCAWMWEVIGKETYYLSFPDAWCHFGCEVIGNIHENPELVKGETEHPLLQRMEDKQSP